MTATETHVTHRALDGRRVLLSGPLNLTAPFTSVIELAVGAHRHELTAGRVGLTDDVAAALDITGFDEEYRFQGGTLLTAQTRPYDPQTRLVEERLVAVWQGRHYCFFTQLYRATTADLIGLLRTVRIVEHEDGLAVEPDHRAGTTLARPASVLKEIPGLGLLEISPLTSENARQLPSWSGLRTAAGELFQDTLSDGRPYFVLATSDIFATLVPLTDTVVEQVPELLGRLRLSHPD